MICILIDPWLNLFISLNESAEKHRKETFQNMVEMFNSDPHWLKIVITGNETWVYGYDPETKRQPSQWLEPGEPRFKEAKKFAQDLGLDCSQKKRRVNILTLVNHFLERYEIENEGFIDRIVTGGGSWIHHLIPDSKIASAEWHHKGSPTPKKPKITASAVKVLLSIFGRVKDAS
ncbi:hypothetical protein LAZ67_11001584 [Cordylochernes scorpioides]|uniref:Uncharacterized protein n=1 Tax=Cordylochernes scorpioides TaxID=51811 RepID=A0ABY6KYK0_9ARAC|nr:hypothetical protein LAZ67_11001584 [Cordylochernes scorpioides]